MELSEGILAKALNLEWPGSSLINRGQADCSQNESYTDWFQKLLT